MGRRINYKHITIRNNIFHKLYETKAKVEIYHPTFGIEK